jgi:hypothetical protein
MGKLYEQLAVDNDLSGKAKKIMEETINTFSKKHNLFEGFTKRLSYFEDGRQDESRVLDEDVELSDTVKDKLNYMSKSVINHLDSLGAKDKSNQVANADVVVNGEIIFKNLPATLLLSMEKKIVEIRRVFEAIPTIAPGVAWEVAGEIGEDVYKLSKMEETLKTETKVIFKSVAKATDKHPEQIAQVSETNNIGVYKKQKFSGMLRPSEKSEMLQRIDILMGAVKKARQRANSVEIAECNIGRVLFDFILQ